ncbi:MAG: hypothetical protein P4M11_09120 [Candidatus Pacebacteria bacterium]|nr:hypothetical protein [Candidatus Paceibacterota bacterium]
MAEAEKLRDQSKVKDVQNATMSRQLEDRKKQLVTAQNRIKTLSNSIMLEITKQLETKVKEGEMLKEMLKSAKIEIAGKDKELRRLRGKLGVSSGKRADRMGVLSGKASPTVRGMPNKSVSVMRERRLIDNFYFRQEPRQLVELTDMKELNLEESIGDAKNVTGLNIDLPSLHFPAISVPSESKAVSDGK